MRSRTEDLALWEQRIKERTKSGLSISQWCKITKSVRVSIIIGIKK